VLVTDGFKFNSFVELDKLTKQIFRQFKECIMKLKSIIAACAIGVCSFGASATNYTVGNLAAYGDMGWTTPVGQTGSFTDTYNFSLSAGTYSVGGIASRVAAKVSQQFTSFTGYLTSTNVGFGQVNMTLSELAPGKSQFLTYDGNLSAGNYSMTITGVTHSASALYNAQLIATPVPEPETLAMMLAGLGLIGAVTRRRSNKTEAA
jgi:hypothetical protein